MEDMNAMNMTQQQKDALEIRSYLHDRTLMQYVDRLEASRKRLQELLNLATPDLSTQFAMKRGHIARFKDRALKCEPTVPPSRTKFKSTIDYNATIEQSIADLKIKDGQVFKGIVAPSLDESRACGCVQPPPIVDDVAPYSSIENISVQKLTPEYKMEMERVVISKATPMRASDLWRDKPSILLCIRRPG
ncbi:hypothetical protein QVD17_29149 [Tagetes erecta]|uniref:Uncharacterized protein n=1 Tax=Tagetes erecta TaxID=13708 RepID=A0AAD8KBP9_TARER|nr:hypothetical protein QVD17_29149 [Tagetes erecta]